MIKLSDRLQLIADQIENGETMADIGTDHGFLPLYLLERGISPLGIMCDISGPSLEKAKEASVQFGVQEGTEFRLGDGLAVIGEGEVDAVVIAGMGGILITQILGSDPIKTASLRKFILQPRNNAGLLRKWLYERGFEIAGNALVREGKFICEVITAFSPKTLNMGDFAPSKRSLYSSNAAWDLPPEMTSEDPALIAEYAGMKLEQETKKLNGLKQARNTDTKEIEAIEERIAYFRRFQNDRV